MRRRRFLQVLGLASLGALLRLPISAESALGATTVRSGLGKYYRGDRKGRIYVSADGNVWTLHTYLGPRFKVEQLKADKLGRVSAAVQYDGRSFSLALGSTEHYWLTA